MAWSALAHAQDFELDIPEQELQSALVELAARLGVQLLYSADITHGHTGRLLRGTFTPDAALQRLLEGTGLSFRYTASNTITIEPIYEEEGLRTLGSVRVSGVQQIAATGANGSRDVLATENSGSYAARGAALGSPAPTGLREIPRSVSVTGAWRWNVLEVPGPPRATATTTRRPTWA